MAKRPNPKSNKRNNKSFDQDLDSVVIQIPNQPPAREPIQARTERQKKYINAIQHADLIYGLGPAGTGKTFLAAGLAADALAAKRIKKIIVTRPAVEAGESLGFLPGELEEKYEPYLQPVRQVFTERLGRGPFEYFLKTKAIEPIPLAYMRGMTFKDAWVILDEAQNVSAHQMKMFLTRIGEGSKVIICGDLDQVDIQGISGLLDAVKRTGWIPQVSVVEFKLEDVVRSGLVLDILKSYSKPHEPLPPIERS